MYRIIRQSERVRLQQKNRCMWCHYWINGYGYFTIAWFIGNVGIFD